MSLNLISYFICLKASNQSDLMQHNVPAAIFSHGTIFCVRHSVGAIGTVSVVGAACFPRLRFFPHTALHWTRRCQTQQYALRTATLCVSGTSSAFRCNVSVEKNSVCCFSVLICICGACRRQFHLRHHQFYGRRHLFHLHQTPRHFLCLCHNRWQQ